MKRLTVTLSYGWIVVSLVACQVWLPDERSGLGVIDSKPNNLFLGKTVETTISVSLDPSDPGNRTFDLYYFVRMPSSGKAPKTVVFCAGGPGVFIGPTTINLYTDFLINNGYNVVHYHPRGAGFSQIPAQNKYDRFLRTSYVVQDIEAIRKHFLGPTQKWDAVIGYSFGTVVAQYYAGEYKSNLERLILIGTQSRHAFQTLPDPFDQTTNEILNTNRITLTNIFQRTEFSNTVSPITSPLSKRAHS